MASPLINMNHTLLQGQLMTFPGKLLQIHLQRFLRISRPIGKPNSTHLLLLVVEYFQQLRLTDNRIPGSADNRAVDEVEKVQEGEDDAEDVVLQGVNRGRRS